MAGEWFESVAVAQRRAKRRLPKSVYMAIWAGSERGVTLEDNVAAFGELGFAPHVADLANTRDLSTTVMGQQISLPVLISPTGVQAVHPDGEVAVARAAAARGTAMGLSSFASKPVEDVVAANPQTFFQIYWAGARDQIVGAHRAGPGGRRGRADRHARLVVLARPRLGQPDDPRDDRPQDRCCGSRPRRSRARAGFSAWTRAGRPARPHRAEHGRAAARRRRRSSAPTASGCRRRRRRWDDLRWLREQWDGPFMLKGVMRVDDARRAVDAGVTAISVSNHGGNNLDGTPASIRALPAIAEAVGDQIEVLLDGGIRRGSDVVKALALGARAVMIGRAYLWGLAANGQAGVENVLDILRGGIDSALLGLGRSSIHDLGRPTSSSPTASSAGSA